jgi:putative spermidine/putrescine transport system permease protein
MPVLAAAFRGVVYVFLTLPSVVVVCSSVSETDYLTFPPKGFTLAWYRLALQSKPFMDSLVLSTKLAGLATCIAVIIGTLAAYLLDRYKFWGRTIFIAGVLSPLVIPGIVLAIAILQMLVALGMRPSFWTLLVGHVVIVFPYVVRIMVAALATYDRSFEEAAMSLRAGPGTTALRITLPILEPALLSAAVFAFVMSFGNVAVSIFLGGVHDTTLPTQIFAYVQFSYDPILAAVSTMIIAVTLAVLVLIERLIGYERLL